MVQSLQWGNARASCREEISTSNHHINSDSEKPTVGPVLSSRMLQVISPSVLRALEESGQCGCIAYIKQG
jgi:hypothetical protein